MNKLKKARLLSKTAEVVIPGDEVMPRANVGFWVLLVSFLY
jgi:hypothetical protein